MAFDGVVAPERASAREGHHVDVNEYWEESGPAAAELHELGLERFLAEKGVLADAFKGTQTCVCCMDERVASERGIAVAGSGILLDDAGRAQLIAYLKSRGIKRVTTHEECGALKLYAQAHGLSTEEALAHEKAWTQELNAVLGGSEIKRLGVSPSGSHNARMALIDLTGRFSLTEKAAEALPPTFVITAPAVPVEHVIAQAGVAIDIALGDHGFGERFTKDAPFVLGVVADSAEEIAALRQSGELEKLADAQDGRVLLDTAVVPVA